MDWLTLAQSFPDLAEPVSITSACEKVLTCLAVAVGAVVAVLTGLSFLRQMMRGFGVDDRKW